MFQQAVTTDSSKKGADKLPFAPFLNQEKIESLKQLSADSVQKKTKKNRQQNKATEQQTTTGIKTQATTQSDSTLLIDNKRTPSPEPSYRPIVEDSNLLITDSNITAGTSEFRFSDDSTSAGISNYSSTTFLNSQLYFKEQLLKPVENNPKAINRVTPDWFSIVLLLMIAGITVIKILYRKIFSQMVAAFFSLAVTNQIVRDENMLVQRATILLNIIFYGVGALFLYQLSILFDWNHELLNEGIVRFFLFAIVLAFGYSLKMITLKVLSFIFEIDKPVSTYIFSIFLINNSVGLILIPLIAIFTYITMAKSFLIIYIALALIIFSFLFRLWRATVIGLSLPRFSLYYLFLYFCALEIAPVVIILKTTGVIG